MQRSDRGKSIVGITDKKGKLIICDLSMLLIDITSSWTREMEKMFFRAPGKWRKGFVYLLC